MHTVAAIDLGSSSVKMLLARIEDGRIVPLLDRRVGANLGRDCAPDGTIPQANQDRTLAALRSLVEDARAAGVEPGSIPVIATAAVRNAPNGAAFMQRVQQELGLTRARILSGDEEAQLGYRAATTPLRALGPGRFATLDLGGGSFQLAIGDERQMERGGSTQVGSNLVQTQLLPAGSMDEAALAAADEALKTRAPLPIPLEVLHGRRWAAVGGIALFLRAHFKAERIGRADIGTLRRTLGGLEPEARVELLTRGQSNAERKALGVDTPEGALDSAMKIPAKLTLLLHIMRQAGLHELHVSSVDARFVLLEMLP